MEDETKREEAATVSSTLAAQDVIPLLRQYWGYESFLPMQQESVDAILNRQDSLTILPTGGGKSLCFQLPALAMPGTSVVISPLVSLMKDQVDTLRGLGISAGLLNNTMSEEERRDTLRQLQEGAFQLLYVAPERFAGEGFFQLLRECPIACFVIDEAHCISQWGHDFRPAYRELGNLRQAFPRAGIHAFTATATPPVQTDIARALHLKNPKTLVGDFERPNLLYRVQYRTNLLKQVCGIIDRYPDEGGIIYCISRKDVEDLTRQLNEQGYDALPYHAGLADGTRTRNQEAFISERVRIVVATVAFGMGIDRSNIRYVIHTGMPKSIEHYQQEAGRAGRDRLPAECVLLYSGADVGKWRTIMGAPATEADQIGLDKLYEMSNYCQRVLCRHKFLVEYFGQAYGKDNCGHCDCCLGEFEVLADSPTVARKILSCVVRVGERFGSHHVAQVLKGSQSERITQFGHETLSTYGLLSEYRQGDIVQWIEQLVNLDYLARDPEYQSLRLTLSGRALLKEGGEISLAKPIRPSKTKASPKTASPDTDLEQEADRALFEELRRLRREIAAEQRVPPYIIFGDVTLREMARRKPTTLTGFRGLKGVGEAKLASLCPRFLKAILEFLNKTPEAIPTPTPASRGSSKEEALAMFAAGASFDDVLNATGRTESTVTGYLCDYLRQARITEPEPWLQEETFRRICGSALKLGLERLKPLWEDLAETVTYDEIRVAAILMENRLRP